MKPRENQYLKQFLDGLGVWTDERFISRKQLRALAMFSMYLVNLAESDGWELYGHSYTQKGRMGCLVVKADKGGIPQVVFTNDTTFPGCVVTFIRRLEAGELEWRNDRYRG